MANGRKSMQISSESHEVNNYMLYFNKYCECGKFINEHLLPNFVCESSLSKVFVACVEQLIGSNICMDSTRFASCIVRTIGNYYEMKIVDTVHLRRLLTQLCELCEACPNFIAEKIFDECLNCDGDNNGDDDGGSAGNDNTSSRNNDDNQVGEEVNTYSVQERKETQINNS